MIKGCAKNMAGKIYSYENFTDAFEFLVSHLKDFKPKVGIVCGSGLTSLTSMFDNGKAVHPPVDYSALPHFSHLKPTVPGHAGRLHFGFVQDVPAVIADGRIHPYEGYSVQECCLPILLMRKLGVSLLLLSNASGSCRQTHRLGTIVALRDHVDLPSLYAGSNVYYGLQDERFWSPDLGGTGSRFVPVRGAYDESLRSLARQVAKAEKWTTEQYTEGVYARMCGPLYDTAAERRSLRTAFGADVIGMSTTYEASVGAACGMKVLALSVVTETDPDFDGTTTPTPPASGQRPIFTSQLSNQGAKKTSETKDAAGHHKGLSHLDVLREAEKAAFRLVIMFRELTYLEFKSELKVCG